MKLVNYVKEGATSLGILVDSEVFDVYEAARDIGINQLRPAKAIEDVLSNGWLSSLIAKEQEIVSSSKSIPLEKVKLASPIINPEKIFLAAVNYLSHGKEQDMKPPSQPYFFTKFRNSVIGHGDPILIPKISTKVDWEVELAVVIGKRGKYISKNEAQDFIAGYTIANDVSFRDLQFPEGWPTKLNALGQNWVKGKGLDNALPLGPWLVTVEELKDPYDLDISLSVNGEARQKSNTSEMVFKAEDMIEYLSTGLTLEPGDVICTGTPLGVAAFTGAPYLKDGDTVEASIEKIGTLRNRVTSDSNTRP
jgi:2-keto-4-pentenoate hydratase/2-oxohepta-3-ene-1,7-dioic acid hydratase in catechol pathway